MLEFLKKIYILPKAEDAAIKSECISRAKEKINNKKAKIFVPTLTKTYLQQIAKKIAKASSKGERIIYYSISNEYSGYSDTIINLVIDNIYCELKKLGYDVTKYIEKDVISLRGNMFYTYGDFTISW